MFVLKIIWGVALQAALFGLLLGANVGRLIAAALQTLFPLLCLGLLALTLLGCFRTPDATLFSVTGIKVEEPAESVATGEEAPALVGEESGTEEKETGG